MKPDIHYTDRDSSQFLPSWTHHQGKFINDQHSAIFETTAEIEGYQTPADSQKLFEMGYYAGDVILEIGTYAGRSATVELLGALSNPLRQTPQYYGIDVSPNAIARTGTTLKNNKLDAYALMYCGNISTFISQFDITPTMVFVDGDHSYDGVRFDLAVLSHMLVKDTPVLCHDYRGPSGMSAFDHEPPAMGQVTPETMWIGVQKACLAWEGAGFAEYIGTFGGSALFLTTSKCSGNKGGLRRARFEQCRSSLNALYSSQYAAFGVKP
jgi:hypothetical protein